MAALMQARVEFSGKFGKCARADEFFDFKLLICVERAREKNRYKQLSSAAGLHNLLMGFALLFAYGFMPRYFMDVLRVT
jgi:hypothetical protein